MAVVIAISATANFSPKNFSGLQRDSNTWTRILGADQFTEFIFEFMGSNPVEAQM